MSFDVVILEPVIEEVTPDFGSKNANHGSKIEKCDSSIGEEIRWWLDELGNRSRDANRPHVDNEKKYGAR